MVTIGTHGAKGRDPFFLGSNTYKVVNHLKVPVLAVQGTATDPNYKKVFMPLDETFNTREKIPYAKLIAQVFDAELSITGLQKHTDKESVHHLHAIINQAGSYVSDEVRKVSTHIHPSKNNAADTLRYAEEQKADLIVIMSEQERTLSGLFLGPYAQQVVNASRIPVLIVPPRVSLVMTSVSI
jgi:nucleotide-binding universal stress UspA family protein